MKSFLYAINIRQMTKGFRETCCNLWQEFCNSNKCARAFTLTRVYGSSRRRVRSCTAPVFVSLVACWRKIRVSMSHCSPSSKAYSAP